MRTIRRIIIHCTATRAGQPFDIRDVRRWHTDPPPRGNGWKDVGYHKLVLLDGTVQRGREDAVIGAHVAGHNADSLGIAYVGGVSADGQRAEDTRTPAQIAALDREVEAWLELYGRGVTVHGHHEYNSGKACPSYSVIHDIALRGLPWRHA